MRVRLLVCARYHDSPRVSTAQCAKRSKTKPGTACQHCPVGLAAARGEPTPEAWPDGTAVAYRDVRVHGTMIGGDGVPVRGRSS